MTLNFSQIRSGMLAVLALAGGFSAEAQADDAAKSRNFSAFKIISDRNIFDPNRRGHVQRSTRSTPRSQPVMDSFSLVGTMSYSNVLVAFFDGTKSEFRKSISVGDQIGGYSATEIGANVVTLVSGTNQVALKVGMQMRHREDGTWFAAETPVSSSSYASDNSNRSSDRYSSYGHSGYRSDDSSHRSQTDGSAPAMDSNPGSPLPAALGNLDPNDPVARLILRRLQEEGGVPPSPAPELPPPTDRPDETREAFPERREAIPTENAPSDETNQNQNIPDNGNENNRN